VFLMELWVKTAIATTPLLALLVVFIAGAVGSMGFCTLARLPVVLGFVGGTTASKRSAMHLTWAFIAGMILCFVVIGIVFGLLGNIGQILIHWTRWIYLLLGLFLLIAGLSIAGLIPLRIFPDHCSTDSALRSKTVWGAFLFGIAFALLETPACPCCSAMILVLASLSLIHPTFIYSLSIFTSFALGQAVPILLIGSSTGLIKTMIPQVQRYTPWIQLVTGSILLVLGGYFVVLA
jgi:cytochrome c biogenesis protein CcdA